MNRFSVNPLFPRFLVVSFLLTVAWIVFMRYQTKPFTSEEIVRFELAGSLDHAKAIMKEWEGKDWIPLAKDSVYLDFIFIFLYAATLALGCLTLPSLTGKINLMTWGMRLYRFSLYAGLADFIENWFMLEVLYGSEMPFFPMGAWGFAFIKFSLIIIVLLFLFRCIISWIVSRFASRNTN